MFESQTELTKMQAKEFKARRGDDMYTAALARLSPPALSVLRMIEQGLPGEVILNTLAKRFDPPAWRGESSPESVRCAHLVVYELFAELGHALTYHC